MAAPAAVMAEHRHRIRPVPVVVLSTAAEAAVTTIAIGDHDQNHDHDPNQAVHIQKNITILVNLVPSAGKLVEQSPPHRRPRRGAQIVVVDRAHGRARTITDTSVVDQLRPCHVADRR